MNLNDIRLIAVDVDGTLLNSRKELTDPVRAAVAAVRERGVLFTIATGRDILGLRKLGDLLSEGVPVITYNGAELRRAGSEELILGTYMQTDAAREVIGRGLSGGFSVIVWSRGELFIGQPGPACAGYSEMYGIREKELRDPELLIRRGVTKIIWAGRGEEIAELERRLHARPIRDTVCCTSEASYLEFMASGVDKGAGLAAAAEALGLTRRQVMAVGDGHNDLPMLRWAGCSAAMGNASESVREAADFVVPSSDDDGLAAALRLVCDAYDRSKRFTEMPV